MMCNEKVKKTKKGDIVTRFWYTLKNLDTMVSFGHPKHKETLEFA
jgi:hypothetical protein